MEDASDQTIVFADDVSYRQDSWMIMETMSNVDVKTLYVTLSMAQLFTLQT